MADEIWVIIGFLCHEPSSLFRLRANKLVTVAECCLSSRYFASSEQWKNIAQTGQLYGKIILHKETLQLHSRKVIVWWPESTRVPRYCLKKATSYSVHTVRNSSFSGLLLTVKQEQWLFCQIQDTWRYIVINICSNMQSPTHLLR